MESLSPASHILKENEPPMDPMGLGSHTQESKRKSSIAYSLPASLSRRKKRHLQAFGSDRYSQNTLEIEAQDDENQLQDTSSHITVAHTSAKSEMGIIEEIYCENFMCHQKLRVELSPHINFITGENGSGKSAIIAAIQICLGASARSTHRGKSLKNLIRHGHDGHALLRVTLRNDGSSGDAFRSSDFGKKVLVERLLRRDGSAEYRLKNESGFIVSKLKQDLEAILDHFNIHTENPCTVLDQENAKLFIKGGDEDKYQFFLRSTDLYKMRVTYAKIDEETQTIEGMALPREQANLKTLECAMEEAIRRWEDAQSIEKLDEELKQVKKELAWSFVQEKEQETEDIARILNQEKQNLEKLEKEYQESLTNVTVLEQEQSRVQEQLEKLNERSCEIHKRKDTTRHVIREKRRPLHASKAELKQIEHQKGRLNDNMQQLETRIKQKQDQYKKSRANRQEWLDSIQQKLQQERSELSNIKREMEAAKSATENSDCTDQLQQVETRYESFQRQIRDVENEIRRVEQRLHNLQSQSLNALAVFGNRIPTLHYLIQSNVKRFQDPPLGPLGLYVRLPEEHRQYAVAIEVALKGSLQSYLVTNGRDKALLDDLKRQANCPANQATIIIAKRATERYTNLCLPGGELARHAICNLLEIKDPNVFNALIDVCSIENKVCIADRNTAESQVLQGTSGSYRMAKWVKEVYLPSGDKFVARNGNLAYIAFKGQHRSGIICHDAEADKKENEQRRDFLRSQRQKLVVEREAVSKERERLVNAREELESKMNIWTRRYHQAQHVCENLEEEARPDTAQDQQADISMFEQEREEIGRDLVKLGNDKQMILARLTQGSPDLENLLRELEECDAEEKNIEKALNNLQAELEQRYQALRTDKSKQMRLKRSLDEKENLVQSNDERHRICQLECKELCRKAQQHCNSEERIVVKESHDFYGKKLTHIQQKIDRERQRFEGMNLTDLAVDKEEKTLEFERQKTILDRYVDNLQELRQMLQVRQNMWKLLRNEIAHRSSMEFNRLMLNNNFAGKLKFSHSGKTLEITVVQNDQAATTRASRVTDMKELSGGERSYTQISLLIALGQCIECPFRVMDEFDVFMDAVNRDMAIQLLVQAAKRESGKQFIFVTPNDLSALLEDSMIKIQKMNPPRDRLNVSR
uniref:Structural maintenance of chromosomes protein 6 puta n=1 Tax=Albugo laibachii Nc14 TaxID=890382 RepID=F0WWZ6_9STRA|nr:structural maintenance of chromosomes protein 6 puta [Albugo laibachii Nc14]|eukprot:CCA25982.1 structural maintenance of chromosomes protein 6 puta [Albugo laibachii Nc14]